MTQQEWICEAARLQERANAALESGDLSTYALYEAKASAARANAIYGTESEQSSS